MIKLLLAMMFLFHWIACVWHLAAVSSPGDNWIVNYFGLSGDDDGGGGDDGGGELTEVRVSDGRAWVVLRSLSLARARAVAMVCRLSSEPPCNPRRALVRLSSCRKARGLQGVAYKE